MIGWAHVAMQSFRGGNSNIIEWLEKTTFLSNIINSKKDVSTHKHQNKIQLEVIERREY